MLEDYELRGALREGRAEGRKEVADELAIGDARTSHEAAEILAGVALMTTLISGCVRGPSDGGLVLAENYCPALVRYSKQGQLAHAEELKKLYRAWKSNSSTTTQSSVTFAARSLSDDIPNVKGGVLSAFLIW